MSIGAILAIGLGGGLGALARFQLDRAVSLRAGTAFPAGTFVVNVSGSFLLGLLTGLALPFGAQRFFAVGVLGSYTTFSTWMLETHRLGEGGQDRLAALNIVASLVAGILAVWLGRAIGELF